MAIQFKDPGGFWKETAAVTIGAAVAGAAVGVAGLAGAPMEAAAGAAALFGGCVAAAVVHETPAAMTFGEKKPLLRGVVGAIGGALAGLGFAALSWRLNLGMGGIVGAGALGGLALGTLLGGDGAKHRASQVSGLAGATIVDWCVPCHHSRRVHGDRDNALRRAGYSNGSYRSCGIRRRTPARRVVACHLDKRVDRFARKNKYTHIQAPNHAWVWGRATGREKPGRPGKDKRGSWSTGCCGASTHSDPVHAPGRSTRTQMRE